MSQNYYYEDATPFPAYCKYYRLQLKYDCQNNKFKFQY